MVSRIPFRILKMCGSSWSSLELGLFIDGEIKLNFGYTTSQYFLARHSHFGPIWWHKR